MVPKFPLPVSFSGFWEKNSVHEKHIRLSVFVVTGRQDCQMRNTQHLGTFRPAEPDIQQYRGGGWWLSGRQRRADTGGQVTIHMHAIPHGQTKGCDIQANPAGLKDVHRGAVACPRACVWGDQQVRPLRRCAATSRPTLLCAALSSVASAILWSLDYIWLKTAY